MYKHLLIVAILAGCTYPEPPRGLSNEQIIAETKVCEDNKMRAQPIYYRGHGSQIIRIQCEPRRVPRGELFFGTVK